MMEQQQLGADGGCDADEYIDDEQAAWLDSCIDACIADDERDEATWHEPHEPYGR
jgi:hypothetical protein